MKIWKLCILETFKNDKSGKFANWKHLYMKIWKMCILETFKNEKNGKCAYWKHL